MNKKRRIPDQNKVKSLAEAGKAGLLMLEAASLLPARSLGCKLIALGEKMEKIACAAKITISIKRKKPAKKAQPFAEEPDDFSVEQVEVLDDEPEEPAAPQTPAPVEPEEDEPSAPDFTANGDLALIDAAAEPERYAELLKMEQRGEVELVRRYRRSYESRLIQSKDPMQDYYSGLKNALLRYKGVKSRVSWANETFHQGRNHLAKIIVKTSCLYIYLSIDPESLKGTKYENAVDDVSDTKKFGEFPTVIKIKGERKYKYALELIDRLCAEDLALPQNKKFVEVDYRRPTMSDEELAKEGLVKLLVAAVPKAAE